MVDKPSEGGFNGAAAFKLRKTRMADKGFTARSCFNGAAAFKLRKTSAHCNCSLFETLSFNGAAAFKLRKTGNPERSA